MLNNVFKVVSHICKSSPEGGVLERNKLIVA